MIALELFVSKTLYGRAMRAVAIDKDMCRMLGINVSAVIAITFFIGSGLAAAAGTMAGAYYGSIWYFMGFLIGLKAFTAAVIGGIGSITGAMLGGLILGLLESFGTHIRSSAANGRMSSTFAILILVLVFKPTGLLGNPKWRGCDMANPTPWRRKSAPAAIRPSACMPPSTPRGGGARCTWCCSPS